MGTLLLYVFCIALLGLSGCESGLVATCQELPKIQEEVRIQRQQWMAYLPAPLKTGRSIASVAAPAAEFPGYEDSKSWAGDLVKKSTLAKDSLEDEDSPPHEVMKEMTSATMTLVHVHGYLNKRDLAKAYESLGQFEVELSKISEKLCRK